MLISHRFHILHNCYRDYISGCGCISFTNFSDTVVLSGFPFILNCVEWYGFWGFWQLASRPGLWISEIRFPVLGHRQFIRHSLISELLVHFVHPVDTLWPSPHKCQTFLYRWALCFSVPNNILCAHSMQRVYLRYCVNYIPNHRCDPCSI